MPPVLPLPLTLGVGGPPPARTFRLLSELDKNPPLDGGGGSIRGPPPPPVSAPGSAGDAYRLRPGLCCAPGGGCSSTISLKTFGTSSISSIAAAALAAALAAAGAGAGAGAAAGLAYALRPPVRRATRSSSGSSAPRAADDDDDWDGGACDAADGANDAVLGFLARRNATACSAGVPAFEWQADLWYTNFIGLDPAFFASPTVMDFGRYLFNYEDGYFTHRWTDQIFWHKAMGLFLGPDFQAWVLDFSRLRCRSPAGRRHASLPPASSR